MVNEKHCLFLKNLALFPKGQQIFLLFYCPITRLGCAKFQEKLIETICRSKPQRSFLGYFCQIFLRPSCSLNQTPKHPYSFRYISHYLGHRFEIWKIYFDYLICKENRSYWSVFAIDPIIDCNHKIRIPLTRFPFVISICCFVMSSKHLSSRI